MPCANCRQLRPRPPGSLLKSWETASGWRKAACPIFQHAARLLLAALCALILPGCVTPKDAATRVGQTYVVTSNHCDFYSFGPAQATGPDFSLNTGQQVVMVSYEYGYSRVSIPGTSQTGYVPTEQIAPAPPPPPQPKAGSPTPAPAPAQRRRRADYESLPPIVPGEQVPLPELPETKPPPGSPPFRY